ncbi:hypothetical protein, conserved [Entamoeba dispar SAW760]|uniref:Calcineurin-like phosphoesterase domain-containing protein n=1 Tax=Entamoeba dispar (strain ATCC PRA-260 / SAW760) TaxID=370354 RepID=B0EQD6_ENTDS|nr:uncharacterized protein EDI_121980 [Entamoeba dispar SAW760]EDR23261.1 hypothetical protein, conserved [Entamoeba dispar SAW760]|eukprot:EDR23261.1 hypothetical protein, conserved [Entamoeba dispar SAW760]
MNRPILISILSDTHGLHEKIKIRPCDFLIICGDISKRGKKGSLKGFKEWLNNVPADNIILVFGNHEKKIIKELKEWLKDIPKLYILNDSIQIINNIQFLGFSFPINEDIVEWVNNTVIKELPLIIISHEPPYGILDLKQTNSTKNNKKYKHGGSNILLKYIISLQPQLCCFGHCHYSTGTKRYGETLFVNAAIVNEFGQLSKLPKELICFNKYFFDAVWSDSVKDRYFLFE